MSEGRVTRGLQAVVCLCLAAAASAGIAATGAPVAEDTGCESQSPGGDFIVFSCQLPSHRAGTSWRFRAEFAGGHDDTSASMTVTLDGKPFECAAGSKTRLFGEDGNVSLVCRFDVRDAVGAPPPVLEVSLLWSHAQYVRAALTVDDAGR